jgi:hypothetical protein
METAGTNFSRRLAITGNSYGFFFYAGHGVEHSRDDNYLIPVDINRIDNHTDFSTMALSLRSVTGRMSGAGNRLNMIVLDVYPDYPFIWLNRNASPYGLRITRAPHDSIIMNDATVDSETAYGNGRNSNFTSQLLNNLKTPGLSVYEVFDKTRGDVFRITNKRQKPEFILMFSGSYSVYLGTRPATTVVEHPADGFAFETVDGKSVTVTKYSGNAELVHIPGRIQGLPVTAIGDSAFAGCNSLADLTIPSSVTSIGDKAFLGCRNLYSVTIPSSVTSIGDGAFIGCSSLMSIRVDSLNPAYAGIDGVLFDKTVRTLIAYPVDKNTETYIIPSSVTAIGNSAFAYCGSLTGITIPSSVTSIGDNAFYDCPI